MTFTIKINNTESKQWTEESIIKKLQDIKKVKKEKQWIRSDLSVRNSNWLTRLIWTTIGKRFLRKIYHIDLENSKSILKQIEIHLPDTKSEIINSLFKEAILNFNRVAPKHSLKLSNEDDDAPAQKFFSIDKIDHGIISDAEAEELLKHAQPGTYLVRQQLNLAPNILAVSYVTSDYKVAHLYPKSLAVSPETSLNDLYLIMEKFVDSKKDILYHPLPPAFSVNNDNPDTFIPPHPSTEPTVTPSAEFNQSVRTRVKSGEDPAHLFELAVRKLEPECAYWLIQNSLDSKILDDFIPKNEREQNIIDWLKKIQDSPSLTPENLDFFAEELGYGYKTANLMILENTAKSISQKMHHCEVKVPPFHPISDFEIKNILSKSIPNLESLWLEFLDSFPLKDKQIFLNAPSPEQAAQARLQISNEGKRRLASISHQIENYFRSNPYRSLHLDKWVNKHQPKYVIIRSTGREDSDDNTNPGGNKSVPYITPNTKNISNAIGEVLASYFSENSIMQRLAVGDQTLFTTKMFLPVLIQEMVGESPIAPIIRNDEIYRAGVIFSEEPEKATGVTLIQAGFGNGEGIVNGAVAADTYYAKKSSTTFEVKNAKVPSSAFPTNESKSWEFQETIIHSVIREKPTRQVGKKINAIKYDMITCANDENLKRQQAIPDPLIKDIKTAADFISDHYGTNGIKKAMDIEYALKLPKNSSEKAVFYLLQARALSTMKKKETSYIDGQKLRLIPDHQIVKAKTLLDGQAYARPIDSYKKILFTTDLRTARTEYLKDTSIEVIVLNQSSSVTSHDGVLLRRLGVPVFVIEDQIDRDLLRAKASQATPQKPLIFDPQRSIVVFDNSLSIIKKGLISYSIPLELSVPVPKMSIYSIKGPDGTPIENLFLKNGIKKSKETISQEVHKLRIESLNTKAKILVDRLLNGSSPLPLKTPTNNSTGYSIRDLFDLMSAGSKIEAQQALGTLILILHKKLHLSMKNTPQECAAINQPLFVVFENILKLTQKELIPAFENYQPESPDRLFPIKFLEALVYQQPSENIIGGASFADTLQLDSAQKKLVKSAEEAGIKISGMGIESQLKFEATRKQALSKTCSESWTQFVKQLYLPSNIAHLKTVQQILEKVEKVNATPFFLNIFFAKIWGTHKSNFSNMISLLDSLISKDSDLIDWAIAKNDEIQQFNLDHASKWSTPTAIAKNLPQLQELVKNCEFLPPNAGFAAKYKKTHEFGRLILLQMMGRIIETTDITIKAISGNTEYLHPKQKLKDFVTAASSMRDITTTASTLLTPTQQESVVYTKKTDEYQNYFNKLDNGGTYQFGFKSDYMSQHDFPGFVNLRDSIMHETLAGDWNEQFSTRPQFIVESIALGSKADTNFSVHWPKTVEEDFTCRHQTCEFIRRFLIQANGVSANILDGPLKKLSEIISNKFQVSISEIECKGNPFIGFHIPLRQHSGSILLEEDEKGIIFRVEMLGNNEHSRWEQGATLGALLGYQGKFSLNGGIPPDIRYGENSKSEKPTGVKFSLLIPKETSEEDLQMLITQIYTFLKVDSMGGIGADDPSKFLNRLKQNSSINFANVDPRFFEDSFFVTSPLLQEFLTNQQFSVGIQAAKHTLIGLAKRNLKSFEIKQTSLQHALSVDNMAVKQYCKENSNNLAQVAVMFLGIGLSGEKSQEALQAIKELKNHPDVKKNLPQNLISKLDEFVDQTKTPDEIFQHYWNNNHLENALFIALTHSLEDRFETIKSKIKQKIMNHEIVEMLELAHKLNQKNYKVYANSWIIDQIPQTTENQVLIKKITQKSDRIKYYNNLHQSLATLKNRMGKFNMYAKEMITASVDGLIGLSQGKSFVNASFHDFSDLEKYLNRKPYSYIFDNIYSTTTKLRKAGPLYIIQGLESSDPSIRKFALEELERLITDYLQIEIKNEHTDAYLIAILSICRGYYDSETQKNIAKQKLKEMWENNTAILEKLAKEPYKVNVHI